ncbi:MAG: hypothetical protein BWY49_00760 [Candidatus Omnitrophica bacterium ADurb.Bin314]|jgi:putative endonuclease|nr:MAG: hypothetical protein BWY49_00760 [Candidatus Omnitrophica bacterium ADurb.Bin314]HOE68905.1 YraN family protein [Candidatus Omnitrophota bacterium]
MKIAPNPKPFRYSVGDRGEVCAAEYLRKKGFKVLQANYRCALGEIDLVAEKAGRIHFVEVKTRSGKGFGSPEAAVDLRKQVKLVKLAAWYLKDKRLQDPPVSFDVMGITLEEGLAPEIRFFEGAFEKGEVR